MGRIWQGLCGWEYTPKIHMSRWNLRICSKYTHHSTLIVNTIERNCAPEKRKEKKEIIIMFIVISQLLHLNSTYATWNDILHGSCFFDHMRPFPMQSNGGILEVLTIDLHNLVNGTQKERNRDSWRARARKQYIVLSVLLWLGLWPI